ncbi:HAD family hydrolase [Priestia megaterium]|nr:HAD family hydrolase [Priestia megaterium]
MKKLIALDVDGTLLTNEHEMTEENRKAIKLAQEKGHVVMICSGRAPESVLEMLKEIEIDCPFAASNGAVVYDKEEILSEINLSIDQVEKISNILDLEGMPYRLYTNKGVYEMLDWKERVEHVINSGKVPKEYKQDERFELLLERPASYKQVTYYTSLSELKQVIGLTIQKFFVLTLDPVQKNRLNQILQEVANVGVTTSAIHNIEIMNEKAHKGYGIQVMAEHFKIHIKDTVAIGDNYNDMPMFEAAGLSVAMGNAEEEIKEYCDVVTKTNKESGVAHAIYRVLNP